MAASAATASSSSGLCPNYAVICSFLERYGALLDLPELTFPQLERYLQDTSSVPKLLADLHVKLLRKIGKSVSADRWEKYLVKICQEVNATWAWELEQKGYKELPVECKTAILKYLCECQFDENVKFKTAINDEDPDKMRVQPIGRDKDGQMYWFQLDQDNNVRVYLEEQDDLDGSSWKCIVRTRNDLAEVVALLKTQIDPELLKRDLELKNKTDGGEDKEKAEGDTKKTEDTSEEEGKDSNKTVCSETNELTQKDELKSEDSEAKSTLNGIVEGKPEAELDSENVSTKAQNIKEEQMEETDIKPNSTEPTPSYETSCVSLKEEKVEVKKNSSEQIQHAMKNDQQAKIPLKKRGMKFSEGFEKNGAITAQNPSVTNLKEAPEAESNSEPPQKIQRVNDQVNGEVQPPSEKEPLKEAAADKEQTNKSRENAVSAANEDGLQEKKSDMCSIETLKEAKSPQSDSKRIEDVQEEKETDKRESHKSSQSSREPTTACKDNNNGAEKSSNHEKLENITKITESKSDGDGTSTEKKTNSVKETDKTNSENLNSNHEVKSKEVDSEVKSSCVDIDTSESKQITDSTKTETSDSNADKSDSSAPKEKRESTKTDTQFAEKGPPEKSVDSKVIVSPSVIKKSDKPVISDKSEETVNIKKGVEPPAVTKESESSKPDEKSDKIIENSNKACETEKENSEGVKKINNCDDHSIDVTTIKDPTSRSITEETLDGKDNLAKPQGDNKIDITSVERKTADDACEGKAKPSGPVEKTKTCEETDEKSQRLKKEEEKMSEKDSKETSEEHPSESIKDAAEDNKNLPNDKRKEDSSTDEVLKSETKEDKKPKKQRKTSTDKDESELKKSSKEPDVESSKEAEKQPSKEAATDEQSKNKTKEVENGTEASSEEGVRRKNRLPIHRRRAELQREERQGDSESDTNTGRCLRRSPRISKPTQKAVEIQDKKTEKSPADPLPQKHKDDKNEKEEEEVEEEETEVKTVQKKPKEKKADQESQPKPKGRKRRRTRWSNTRTRRKKKDSEDEDDNSDEESSEEEESEEEDDSDEDYKVERSRKRRNRNRERRSSDSSTSSDDDLPPNDDPCKHCGLPNHPELILLCDSCDNGYHTACLRPPLMIIPDGEWFCPPCQHKQLCDKLEEQLQNLDSALKKKERAERRKERLIYVGISVENIIAPSVEVEEEKPEIIIKEKKEAKRSKSWGRRSTRAKKTISYRFDEFDEAIEEAIEEDIKEAEGGGAGRGKDMANITGLRGKDISTILQAEEGKENGRPPRPSAAQRKKKRRRLNDLDSDSTVDEEESEDEFCLSESSEEEFVASDNESEPETEQDSNDSNFGSNKSSKHHSSSRTRRPQKLRQSSRKRRRPKWYSDDEEEETDDDVEEDEMVTEGSSDFSDSDLDMSRRRSRRSLKKAVNYCETSESEGSQAETNRAKMKPRRRQESSESDASFSRDSEEDSKDRREKRRVDSSEEDSRQRRRRLALKRRRASEEDDSDDDSDESSEEDRPIRKRVNRIDSDDDDEEEQEENPKEKKSTEEESKGTNPSDCSMVELQPANGQSEMKSFEGFISRPAPAAPGLVSHLEPPKNISSTPAAAIAPNGLAGQEGTAQDDDEDDLLGVTDLVDYVCNNEQL